MIFLLHFQAYTSKHTPYTSSGKLCNLVHNNWTVLALCKHWLLYALCTQKKTIWHWQSTLPNHALWMLLKRKRKNKMASLVIVSLTCISQACSILTFWNWQCILKWPMILRLNASLHKKGHRLKKVAQHLKAKVERWTFSLHNRSV